MQRHAGLLTVTAILIGMSAGLAACAAKRPVLYPNPRLEAVGWSVANRDIDECTARAEQYAEAGGREADVARSTAIGAGGGAAVGAVGGAVSGSGAGQGAAIGAATGATAGFLGGLFGAFGSREPAPLYRNFVERCLSGKGYEVIGWD